MKIKSVQTVSTVRAPRLTGDFFVASHLIELSLADGPGGMPCVEIAHAMSPTGERPLLVPLTYVASFQFADEPQADVKKK